MWDGHEEALVMYGLAMVDEWVGRGYKDTCADKMLSYVDITRVVLIELPSWIGDDRFHASHRSNLLRKLPEHYSTFGWKEPDDLPYVWPSVDGVMA